MNDTWGRGGLLCLTDLRPTDLRTYAPPPPPDQRPLFWEHKDTQPKESIEKLQRNGSPQKYNLIYIATWGDNTLFHTKTVRLRTITLP